MQFLRRVSAWCQLSVTLECPHAQTAYAVSPIDFIPFFNGVSPNPHSESSSRKNHPAMKKAFVALTIAALALGFSSQAKAGTNLIQNGDFETGDLTGWSQFGDTFWTLQPAANKGGFGNYLARQDGDATLSQSFSTLAGNSYTLGFYAGALLANPPGSAIITVQIDGRTLETITSQSVETLTLYSQDFTATNPTTTLSIEYNWNSASGGGFLDNVSVTSQAVPEPSTWAMSLVAGLGLLAYCRRR